MLINGMACAWKRSTLCISVNDPSPSCSIYVKEMNDNGLLDENDNNRGESLSQLWNDYIDEI